MTKEFSNKTASKTSFIIGGIMGIVGIAFTLFWGMLGLLVIALGIVLFLVLRYFGNDTTIICHDHGFNVKLVNKRKGTTMQEYKWADVTATVYFETESGGEDSTTSRFFTAKTSEATIFRLPEIKGFADLIKTFNENTLHLPYTWEKTTGFSDQTYIKKPRDF